MSVFNEALEWQDRAEQARQVARQLADPGAKQAMLQAAKGYELLARAADDRAKARHDFVLGPPPVPLGPKAGSTQSK